MNLKEDFNENRYSRCSKCMAKILNDSSTHLLNSVWALILEIFTLRKSMQYFKLCLLASKKDLQVSEIELPVPIKKGELFSPSLTLITGMIGD